MLEVMVWLQSCLFVAWQLPEPTIWPSRTSYLSYGSCMPYPTIPVVPIHQASYASTENSLYVALVFWRLCPSPSRVRHLHLSCPAVYVLHHLPRLPHPAHHRKLQHHPDSLCWHSTSAHMIFGLSGCRLHLFNISHQFLRFYNRCLCVLNSLCCHSEICINKILDLFIFLFVAQAVCCSSFHHRKLLFRLYAV